MMKMIFIRFVCKGAIEGPMEFAEGAATGVRTLFSSTIGGAAGAASKITGVLGKGLATLTFDEDYKMSRVRRKQSGASATTDIAAGGKNIVMVCSKFCYLIEEFFVVVKGFFDSVTGVVTKPISGAKQGGAQGFVKGLGKGFLGLVTKPTGGVADFASTSLNLIKR
jgi:vacuolar protein sorting-associated protein 13A/C